MFLSGQRSCCGSWIHSVLVKLVSKLNSNLPSGFARVVTVPVTPELTLDKQENLSLNLRDKVGTGKIKTLAT